MTSDRGKPIAKASNDNINITFTKDKKAMFDIVFDGDKIDILSYCDASWHTIEYAPKESEWCNQCQSWGCKQL